MYGKIVKIGFNLHIVWGDFHKFLLLFPFPNTARCVPAGLYKGGENSGIFLLTCDCFAIIELSPRD